MRFPLSVPLTGGALDRAAQLRPDPAALSALASADLARLLPLWRGKAPIDLSDSAGPRLAWIPMSEDILKISAEAAVFLGRALDEGDQLPARFAADISSVEEENLPEIASRFGGAVKFIDLRSIASELPATEPAVWAEAKSLLEWHANHRKCSRCGATSQSSEGGWRRDCGACGGKHFPRTDPVVIMLVVHRGDDGLERVLIGRQPNWPPRMHSLLAGYIEPGETVEEAVRRETWEEAGVKVGEVGYLASQPWPFPSTLMIGCWGRAMNADLTVDQHELETARWADKAEMRAALAGEHPVFDAPRRDAIARVLTEAWATDQLMLL